MFFRNIQFDIDADSLDLNGKRTVGSSSNSVFELIVLIVIFVLIIVACYYVTRFIGTKQLKQYKNSNFTVLDTYRVTTNKFLQLVKMGEKYVVIAVTKDHISVITELTKEEIQLPENGEHKGISFKNVLTEMMNKKKNDGKG